MRELFKVFTSKLLFVSGIILISVAAIAGEADIIGIWEGPKEDGRRPGVREPFGPIEIKKAGNQLTATYLGSRTGDSDRKLHEIIYKDGQITIKWSSWGGILVDAVYKDNTITGTMRHHGMTEYFTFYREVSRTSDEIVAEFASKASVKHPPSQSQFFSIILDHGPEAALEIYREVKAQNSDYQLFGAGMMNSLGYNLLNDSKTQLAVDVFKFNVMEYPDDPNSHDSLGEGYLRNGDRELAIKSFEKCLSMNPPANVRENSIKLLRELGVEYAIK